MNHFKLFLQPSLLITIARKLGKSLLLILAVMMPGILLTIAGFRTLGSLALFVGSFSMLARTYYKPWRLNTVMLFIPVVASCLGLLVQCLFYRQYTPSLLGALAVVGLGLLVGSLRAAGHHLYFEDEQLMAERTFFYLIVWGVSTLGTQLAGLFSFHGLVTPGLLSGFFSVSMLFAMAMLLWRKSKTTLQATSHIFKPASIRMVGARSLMLFVGFALLANVSSFASVASGQDSMVTRMVDVGRAAVVNATSKSDGLIEQDSQIARPSHGDGTSLQMKAAFFINLGGYQTDTDSSVEFTRYNDWKTAKRIGDAAINRLKNQSGSLGSLRGSHSSAAQYRPQSGGVAYRAIIQQGNWLIDVDTVAWDATNERDRARLYAGQKAITLELAESVYDNGISSGLIDLEPPSESSLASAGATPTTRGPAASSSTTRDQQELSISSKQQMKCLKRTLGFLQKTSLRRPC